MLAALRFFLAINWRIIISSGVLCSTVMDMSLKRQLLVIFGLHFPASFVLLLRRIVLGWVLFDVIFPPHAVMTLQATFWQAPMGHLVTPEVVTACKSYNGISKRRDCIDWLLWRKCRTVTYFLSSIAVSVLRLKSRNRCYKRTWGKQPLGQLLNGCIGIE